MAKRKVRAVATKEVTSSPVSPEDVAALRRILGRVEGWQDVLAEAERDLEAAKAKVAEAELRVKTARGGVELVASTYNREIEWLRREHGVPEGVPVDFKDGPGGGLVITWNNTT